MQIFKIKWILKISIKTSVILKKVSLKQKNRDFKIHMKIRQMLRTIFGLKVPLAL